jgi:hypothetical protein
VEHAAVDGGVCVIAGSHVRQHTKRLCDEQSPSHNNFARQRDIG